MKFYVLKKI